jgi:hypothetical protein
MKIHIAGKFAFLVCVLYVLFPSEVQSKQKLPCLFESKKLLRTNRGKPLWLSSKQMIERVVDCMPPQLPLLGKGLKVEGIVIAEVLVNFKGSVQCVRAAKGHPLLRSGVVDAVRHWKFKNVIVNNIPVAFLGRLRFVLSSSGRDKKVPHCLKLVSVKQD